MVFKKWYTAVETDAFYAVVGIVMYSTVFVGLALLMRWIGLSPYSVVESIVGAVVMGTLSAWLFGFFSFNSCGIQLRRMRSARR